MTRRAILEIELPPLRNGISSPAFAAELNISSSPASTRIDLLLDVINYFLLGFSRYSLPAAPHICAQFAGAVCASSHWDVDFGDQRSNLKGVSGGSSFSSRAGPLGIN
jgi:hypothetical protein